jgi:glycine hydroxymethyltransferase
MQTKILSQSGVSMYCKDLSTYDPEIFSAINMELFRQRNGLELIASENFVSYAVLEAQGSIMTNKYAEGYPGKRYYGGCEFVDRAEELAISRARELYNCQYVNVQPHSGAQANQAVFLALLQPGDTILGMGLSSGGHLTHGSSVNLSGKWFNAFAYGVREDNGLIDYDEVRDLALRNKPKLIIAGGSSYARIIDFATFRNIADEVGAYLMVDMAHYSGLVAGGVYPSPFPYADVVTTTTHKTLRGPRGGMILARTMDLEKKLNSAVFPGYQGGPLMHVIAAKAVAFKEALEPSFKVYAQQVVDNAKIFANTLIEHGVPVVSGGTDSHLIMADLRGFNLTGQDACSTLEEAGITCNKNSIPNDPLPPTKTSGIRLGTPACTTRGMGQNEFKEIAMMVVTVIKGMSQGMDPSYITDVRHRVESLTKKFPLYSVW